MPNLFDTTLIMIYLLPLLGLLLGILPAVFVWHFSRLKQTKVRQNAASDRVNNGFTLLL